MNGWLVVNGFLRSERFRATYAHILDAARDAGIGLSVKTNVELAAVDVSTVPPDGRPAFVLFWDKDVNLAKRLEASGLCVYNSAHAIEVCDSKALTYLSLMESGIEMPDTIVVPLSFQPPSWDGESFPDQAIERLGLPLVAKESSGSFGEQVHLVHSREELVAVLDSFGTRSAVLQRFVASSVGRDVRVQVVGGRVIASMLRSSGGKDFRANIVCGASAEAFDAPESFEAMALAVCRTIGLDFAGVDILFGEGERPVFCEVNSNAHFEGILACCGVNAADEIVAHIISKAGGRDGR
ncbi:ATP-grasp domain-containing protein [Raoultibacter phocaeensis]|uniref:ATP-grasp domain-containing protein n=1 Tax=Raoultibacter phocaeensis TaxID=2479841 RepID=UPI0015D58DB9|nr:RimK family alpha-L-glutamate ligase [Raoultibacter phocaeensis]